VLAALAVNLGLEPASSTVSLPQSDNSY